MSRKKKASQRAARAAKASHHQGKGYSDVHRDGKAYVYTAWDDNAEEVGVGMSYEQWLQTYKK